MHNPDLNNKVIAKIQKLLQLADTSKNTNLEEATTAAAKAQELMEKYRIEEAMLNKTHASSVNCKILVDEGIKKTWKHYLAGTICKHNGCYLLLSDTMNVIGENKDIETVQTIYKYLVFELNRLCMIEILLFKNKNGFYPTEKYVNGFYLGAIAAIDRRLDAVNKDIRNKHLTNATNVEQREQICDVLAKLDTRIDAAKGWVTEKFGADSIKTVTEKFDQIGYVAGQKAGGKLDLTSDEQKLKGD